MERLIRLFLVTLFVSSSICVFGYGNNNDYNKRQAESYARQAEYYQRQADSYHRDAQYYQRQAESEQRDALYYIRQGNGSRANDCQNRASNAIYRYKLKMQSAADAYERACYYLKQAANALR